MFNVPTEIIKIMMYMLDVTIKSTLFRLCADLSQVCLVTLTV